MRLRWFDAGNSKDSKATSGEMDSLKWSWTDRLAKGDSRAIFGLRAFRNISFEVDFE